MLYEINRVERVQFTEYINFIILELIEMCDGHRSNQAEYRLVVTSSCFYGVNLC